MKKYIILFSIIICSAAERNDKDPFQSKFCNKVYYFPPMDNSESSRQSTLGFFFVQGVYNNKTYFLYRYTDNSAISRVDIDPSYTHLLSVAMDRKRSIFFGLVKNKDSSAGLLCMCIKNKALCLERLEKMDFSLSDNTDHQIFLIGSCLCLSSLTAVWKGSYREIFRIKLKKGSGYDLQQLYEGMVDHRDRDVQQVAQRELKKLGEIDEIND